MPSRLTPIVLLLAAASLVAAGCHKRTATAAPPMPSAPPITTPTPPESAPAPTAAPTQEPVGDSTEAKPENPTASAPTPVAPTPTPPAVPPPKPAAVKPAPRANPPQISPRLTPEEHAVAQRKTLGDISAAERNLQVAYGKQLNATQHDLMEKIRGFLGQAREAMRASDWVRARNLAQKAMVLSVELLNSL